jgi:hypothetical protein
MRRRACLREVETASLRRRQAEPGHNEEKRGNALTIGDCLVGMAGESPALRILLT